MPPSVLRTVMVLGLAAGGVGLWLGTSRAQISETDVINRIADQYVVETGGVRTDCAARPGTIDGIWIIVSCGTAQSVSQYWVDHSGRLVVPSGVPEA